VRPADAAERARLNDLFAELCAIPSPYGSEAACRDRVAVELRAAGLDASVDDAGNLLARIAGPDGARTILLCAHLDTVPHDGGIRPVCEDGVWRNALPHSILGADNKAAVAGLLLVAHRAASEPPPVGVELLFTVGEENALEGAKAFDVGRLTAEWGYVFDHATPIGEVVVASPTYHRIVADFHGASAHAGIRPEDGRSAIAAAAKALAAMPLGRLDDETTANAGTIHGGTGINVVPERCRVELEARSLDEQRVEAVVTEMVDHLQDGANAEHCDLDVTVSKLFTGYRVAPDAPALRAAEAALAARGHRPRRIVTGGGADANALVAAGLPCVCLANGTEANHQPDERVSVWALEAMLDVTFALLAECAAF